MAAERARERAAARRRVALTRAGAMVAFVAFTIGMGAFGDPAVAGWPALACEAGAAASIWVCVLAGVRAGDLCLRLSVLALAVCVGLRFAWLAATDHALAVAAVAIATTAVGGVVLVVDTVAAALSNGEV